MIRARVGTLLRVNPGEGGTVGLAVAIAFLASSGNIVAQSGIDALFFARVGVDKLPVLYLLLGTSMFVATAGVSVLLGRLGRAGGLMLVPIGVGGLAFVGWLAALTEAPWVYGGLWLVRGLADFMLALFVWGLAGMVSDTRQAKRFFPLIAAGSVLGLVLGGVATKPVAAAIGADNLLLVWVGALGGQVLLARRLLATRVQGAVGRAPRRGGPGAVTQMRQGLRYVARSSLLRWMTVGAVLFSLLFFSLYLPFSRAATARHPDPEELAGFFGLFFAASTGLALLVSLFVTSRLLAKLGVARVVLILPVIYVAGFVVLLIRSTLFVVAAFRFVQIVWLQGGAGSAWEAVVNTVPADRRDQARAFMNGGPTQAGTVIAGVVALVGEAAVSPTVLSAVGLGAGLLAAFAMHRVRSAYARELVAALREGRPNVFGAVQERFAPIGRGKSDPTAVSVGVSALSDPDPRVRRLAAHILGDMDSPEARTALAGALSDDDADVRATALGALARSGETSVLLDISERLSDPVAEVRMAALEALDTLRVQGAAIVRRVRPLLDDADQSVRARAAAFLVDRGDPEAAEVVARLAVEGDGEVRAMALRALRAMDGQRAVELALSGLSDPAGIVRAESARTLASVDPEGSVERLVTALDDQNPAVVEAIGEALATVGPPAVPSVVRALSSPALQHGALVALERLPLDGAAADVRRFAGEAVERALESHRFARAIEPGPDEHLRLLRDSLRARAERHAVTALRAAGLLGGRSAVSVALENLSVADPGQRATALEVIETVADPEVVRPLLALWEAPATRRVEPDWLERLRADPDDWIRACAGLVAGPSRGGAMTETLATLPLMERVIFLRKAPLFADLPPPDLKPIAEIAEEHSFVDFDTIAEQGETGDAMHIIVSGEVSVVVKDLDEGERVLAVRSAGDVIGEMSVLTAQPRMAGLVARGDVRLLSIGRRQFEAILRERPQTSLAVIRVLCQRLTDRDAAR